jgi:hypothetical protein
MVDFSDRESDFIYSWRCQLNATECRDTNGQIGWGWTIFAILMISHLMSDLLNGCKLLILSGKARHRLTLRCRFFCKSYNRPLRGCMNAGQIACYSSYCFLILIV